MKGCWSCTTFRMWVKYHSGCTTDRQQSLEGNWRLINLIQLVCRPLALEMKPESESDGMHEGLYGIQSLGFRHA